MRLAVFASVLVLVLFATYGAVKPAHTPAAQATSFPAADLSTNLVFGCLPDGLLSLDLRWQSSNQGAQWVDVSRQNDNFSSYFYGHGPIASGESQITWYALEPNVWYFVRVNTLTSHGWFASPTMSFLTPLDCPTVSSPTVTAPGPSTCPNLSTSYLTGCVWNERADYGAYGIGELVNYCFYVTQPAYVRLIVDKPDNTSIVVVDGYTNATGACFGPFQAYYPTGLRDVRLYGGGYLLDTTHFHVVQ